MSETLDAPIVGVTVYPAQARVTRRGRTPVPAGVTDIVVPSLPLTLIDDSVRVSGRSTGARIVGVDVARRFHAEAPDARVAQLDARLRELRARDTTLADAGATETVLAAFLDNLATQAGARFARALANGVTGPDGVATFAGALTEQLTAVQERSREIARQREDLAREIAAVEQELATLYQQQQTQRREVVVTVEADAAAEVELDVAYLVAGAGWSPVYDARLEGEQVTITWHGLVTQQSGEDWPAAELSLSTARPAVTTAVPELSPWYIGQYRPRPAPVMRSMASDAMEAGTLPPPAPMMAAPAARQFAEMAEPMEEIAAVAEQGATAVTYRLGRPVAVPSDGAPHKATITTVDLGAALDYLTVPKLAEEAYLRATVTNTSAHTLLPGKVSVFHGSDFVGTTTIETVAPGGEVELQLGVDDRLKVERELVNREVSKNLLGGNRKTDVTFRITVENHLPGAARVTVKDQFPIASHESVKIRDQETRPDPVETTDLGEVTWEFELAVDATATAELAFQLEHPKGMQLTGWTI